MLTLELVEYEYSAALLSRTPWDVSCDEDLLVAAQIAEPTFVSNFTSRTFSASVTVTRLGSFDRST